MTRADLSLATLINGRAVELESIPTLAMDDWGRAMLDGVAAGQRVAAMFGVSDPSGQATWLYAVLADDAQNRLRVGRTQLEGQTFPSLTPRCPQVHLFEREIAEQFGLTTLGHPWLKPVRYHRSWTGRDAWGRSADQPILPAVVDFFRVEGDQVHEVAVGPIHAGVIEPGHFRFQCHGERVFHLEIALGFQHRGVEQAMIGGPTKRSMHYVQTLAGDSTIAHATAYCQVIEALARCRKTPRAQTLRGVALELERVANHVGDLGALANDVGFLPTASYCGRIRGDFL
ncbi:MAG TPA: NADH-quinone oxidoreductase subunit C, partial [Phycisphaeraceae bacterium]